MLKAGEVKYPTNVMRLRQVDNRRTEDTRKELGTKSVKEDTEDKHTRSRQLRQEILSFKNTK